MPRRALAAANIQPNPADDGQWLKAIRYLLDQAIANRPLIFPIANLPTQDRGPIIVTECAEVWVWTSSAYYTGYRSILCGRPLDGHTALPLTSEVDAIGGLVAKVGGYAGLWGYAQEQGLVKTEAVWQANRGSHWFSDYSPTQFRLPDLRDTFRRFAGTNADSGGARGMGSAQAQAIQQHMHSVAFRISPNRVEAVTGIQAWALLDGSGLTTDGVGGAETRPRNVAFHPRIHI